MKILVIHINFLFLILSSVEANNNFTPGDAYIYFRFDFTKYKSLQNEGNFTFKGEFGSLEIKGDTNYIKKQTLNAYLRYRSIHDPVLKVKVDSLTDTGIVTGKLVSEWDPLYCFVYNKNYPLEEMLIGFKYNESWMLDGKSISEERFLLKDWMYADNYKYAKQVSGLKVEVRSGKISANVDDICIIIISDDHLKRYLRKFNSEGITVTRIDENKVSVYELDSRYGKFFFKEQPSIEESTEFGKVREWKDIGVQQ